MRRLASAIESSDDAIVTKNLNSIIISWNPAAERMFGYTEKEAIGQVDPHADPRRSAGRRRHGAGQDPRGEKVDHYETVRQRKDGSDAVDLA